MSPVKTEQRSVPLDKESARKQAWLEPQVDVLPISGTEAGSTPGSSLDGNTSS
jgi:hypothetical protein